MPLIATPDQRVRVFVSSTLQGIAAERAAVHTAIDELRLVPVMFELGARPHPPRSLGVVAAVSLLVGHTCTLDFSTGGQRIRRPRWRSERLAPRTGCQPYARRTSHRHVATSRG